MTSGCPVGDPWETGRRVSWQGRELWLACSYRPSSPEGFLLLCLHGAYCNRGDFACVLECEALSSCGVLAIDLPGHGGSAKMSSSNLEECFPARLEDMAEVVWKLLGALELQGSERVLIVGHSLGGAVGLMLARHLRPPHLRGFVSLEGCLVASDTPPNGIAARWMRKAPGAVSALDLLEDIAAARHLGRDPSGVEHWREAAELCGETVHLLALRVSRSLYDWCHSGGLPGLLDGLPVFHYVYGTASGKFTPALQEVLHGRRNCRVHGICGCGHFLLLDGAEASLGVLAGAVAEAAATLPAPASKVPRRA